MRARHCQSKRTRTIGQWPPPVQCCTFCTGRRTDFEVTPNRPTIAVQDHLSESRLRSIRPKRLCETWAEIIAVTGTRRSERFFYLAHSIGHAVDSRCGFLGLWCGVGPPPGNGSSEAGAKIRILVRRRSGRNRFALQGKHAESAFVDPTSRLPPDVLRCPSGLREHAHQCAAAASASASSSRRRP